MLGQKWTYGKEGMVPEAVSVRKKASDVCFTESCLCMGILKQARYLNMMIIAIFFTEHEVRLVTYSVARNS